MERSVDERAFRYTRDAVKILQHEGKPIVVPDLGHVPPDVGGTVRCRSDRRTYAFRLADEGHRGRL